MKDTLNRLRSVVDRFQGKFESELKVIDMLTVKTGDRLMVKDNTDDSVVVNEYLVDTTRTNNETGLVEVTSADPEAPSPLVLDPSKVTVYTLI